MKSNRYNTFYRIHKGLRAMLYETALKIQQTDMADPEAGAPVIGAVNEVLLMFGTHADSEDRFYNIPLENIDSSVATLFEKEHVEDHRLAAQLEQLVHDWSEAATRETRQEIGKELFYSFNEFIAFNLYHMNKEEKLLNQVLWKHYDDQEIIQKERTLVQSLTPEKIALSGRVMARGLNDREIAEWHREVRATAPAPVYGLLKSISQKELPAKRWESIQRALEEKTVHV